MLSSIISKPNNYSNILIKEYINESTKKYTHNLINNKNNYNNYNKFIANISNPLNTQKISKQELNYLTSYYNLQYYFISFSIIGVGYYYFKK